MTDTTSAGKPVHAAHDGLRISLMVDSAILLVGLITATLMYGDVQALKKQQVSESRVVAIEVQLTNLSRGMDDLQASQNENTRRIIDAILRGSHDPRYEGRR